MSDTLAIAVTGLSGTGILEDLGVSFEVCRLRALLDLSFFDKFC